MLFIAAQTIKGNILKLGRRVGNAFQDIETLAGLCRFRDCRHRGEPGCAVAQAIQEGAIECARMESYRKLAREARFLEAKQDLRVQLEEKRRWKKAVPATEAGLQDPVKKNGTDPSSSRRMNRLAGCYRMGAMNFVLLQDSLRRIIRRKFDSGELTGQELARRAGFTQAHISNFVHGKRGLKLRALDRMTKVLGLTLYDLLDPHELARFAETPVRKEGSWVDVPLVPAACAALREVITNADVLELVKIPCRVLDCLRAAAARSERLAWTRFVVIQPDPRDADWIRPRMGPSALLMIDRHHVSPDVAPAASGRVRLFAVWNGDRCLIGSIDHSRSWLAVRPPHPEAPVAIISLAPGEPAERRIIGRVAWIGMEA